MLRIAEAANVAHNFAIEFLEKEGEDLDSYEGLCGDLADGIVQSLGEDRVSILFLYKPGGYIDLSNGGQWNHHIVAMIDGHVHDAWFPELVLPPGEYINAAFPEQQIAFKIEA